MSLHEEVESIQTSYKSTYFTPQVKWNFFSDFGLQAFLSAFCVHDVQSFTVARWTDFLPYNENSLCLCFPYSQRHSVLYCKAADQWQKPEICARLQWQGCTGTFTMIVSDEQLHFYRLCGTSLYSNVLGLTWRWWRGHNKGFIQPHLYCVRLELGFSSHRGLQRVASSRL